MDKRLELHERLCAIINITESNGDKHVYFQPPESVKMKYPAIVYSLSNIENRRADDRMYKQMKAYQVILIDPNPDSKYVDEIAQLPYCRFDRHYRSDNLNHYVFNLYN